MEFIGWVCKNCNRAINSGKNSIEPNSRIKCKMCGKSQLLANTIHSKKSRDALTITEWVKGFNSK